MALFIFHGNLQKQQIFSICLQTVFLRFQKNLLCLSKGIPYLFCHNSAILITGNCSDFSFFIRKLPVSGKFTSMFMVNGKGSLALPIEEHFHCRRIGANAQINKLPFIKVPIRENMYHGIFFIICPGCLIYIVGILGKACCVNLSEVRISGMIRRWLSNVIKACPDKLPAGIWMIPLCQNTCLCGFCAPACSGISKRRTLFILICQHRLLIRKMINSAALNNGTCLTAVNHPIRMLFMVFFIIIFSVIIANEFYDVRTFLRIFPWHVIRAQGNCSIFQRVMSLYFCHEFFYPFFPLFAAYMGIINLISNTPHNQAWMISVPSHPAFYIFLIPLWEKSCIVIRILR